MPCTAFDPRRVIFVTCECPARSFLSRSRGSVGADADLTEVSQALSQELPQGLAAVALNPGVIDTDMLREAWGEGAAAYGGPDEWAERAVPFLEKLGAKDNGGALSVP